MPAHMAPATARTVFFAAIRPEYRRREHPEATLDGQPIFGSRMTKMPRINWVVIKGNI